MKSKKTIWLGVAALGLCAAVIAVVWNFNSTKTEAVADHSQVTNASSGSTADSSSETSSPIQANSGTPSPSNSTGVSSAAPVNRPVSVIEGKNVEYPGQFVGAKAEVDGKSYQLTPNQVGNFPRVLIKPGDAVHVEVAYPEGHSGDAVVVETEDGGTLDGKKMANVTTLDDQKNVQFNFQSTTQPGIYHVSLRSGADVKVLNFWAGPEPVVRDN